MKESMNRRRALGEFLKYSGLSKQFQNCSDVTDVFTWDVRVDGGTVNVEKEICPFAEDQTRSITR